MNYSFKNLTGIERDYILTGLQQVERQHLFAQKNEIQCQRLESADQFKKYFEEINQLRERLETTLPIIEEPELKLLILTEKHDTRYFIIHNSEELHQISLKILEERSQKEWYYPPREKPESPTYSKEELETLKGPAKSAASSEYSQYCSAFRQWKNDAEIWERIQKALKEKDGKLAYQILEERSDYHYEEIKLKTLENGSPGYIKF